MTVIAATADERKDNMIKCGSADAVLYTLTFDKYDLDLEILFEPETTNLYVKLVDFARLVSLGDTPFVWDLVKQMYEAKGVDRVICEGRMYVRLIGGCPLSDKLLQLEKVKELECFLEGAAAALYADL